MKKHLRFLLMFLALFSGSGIVNAQTWTGSDPAEGTFFLYNVGTGKFINVGDKAAGWGTNAYLTAEYGLDFTFELNGGAYNLNSQISNGGSNYYLSTGLWCDGAATPWTFTKVDRTDINAYTISNGDSYIVANEGGTDIEYVALSGTERDQWQLIGSSDILANLQANTADGVKRTVATFFISDPDFGRNDMRRPKWSFTNDGGNVTVPGYGVNQGNNPNYGCEFWNNTFDIHQNLTDLPNGIYEFEIYGYGTNGTTYVYATTADGTTSKVFKNQTSAANFQTALNNIDNYGGNVTGLVQVTDGTLTIGVKRETNSSADWTVIDQARLYYYGDYTFAEAYGADLSELITTAQALVDAAPSYISTEALANTISSAQEVMSTGTTESEFSEATAALQAAIDAYNAQLTLVSRYTEIRTAALAINSALDVTATDATVKAATTSEEIETAITTLRTAFSESLSSLTIPEDPGYIDVTNVLVDNPTVSTNTDYWTIEGTPNTSYSWGVCNYGECEFYQQNFKFYQTLSMVPGTWEFGVTGFHRAGNHSTYFYAGDDKILIPGVESSVVNSMAQAKDYFDAGNGKVSLKFLIETAGNVEIGINNQDTETDKWTIFRNFTLKYYGAVDYSVYENQWAEAVAAANTAKTTYPNVTGTELTAVDAAIADAPDGSSKANYLEKINALTEATQAYIAAATSYNAYVTEKAIATQIGVTEFPTEPTTAAEAATATNSLKVAEFNLVATDYIYDYAAVIGEFGTWTGTATVAGEAAEPNYLTNEHWSGVFHSYYEQAAEGWGNANGWTIKYEKTTKLPAGDYMLKVAARSSAGTTSLVSCTATDFTVTLPNVGAASKGITTAGLASFDEGEFANDGTGYGWEWRFLPFSLTEETEVTMTFYAEASSQYQWMSIADGTLLSKQEIVNDVTIASTDEAAPEATVASSVTTDRKLLEGLNTVVFPFETTATELGAATVLAYTGTTTEEDETLTLNFAEVSAVDDVITLQANVPYAVFVDADQTEALTFGQKNIAPSAELTVADTNGQFDFVGTYTNLAKGNTTVVAGDLIAGADAFVKAKGGNRIAAYRAYMKKVGTSEGKIAFNFNGTVVTGIEAVEILNNLTDGIYNLSGQKLQKVQKGINIVNGKKVLVK